jgi:hypothetical protein
LLKLMIYQKPKFWKLENWSAKCEEFTIKTSPRIMRACKQINNPSPKENHCPALKHWLVVLCHAFLGMWWRKFVVSKHCYNMILKLSAVVMKNLL